ncbi:MAG: ParB/RepB/Spo0J family partition protein [Bifidobacterium sp.]|jgi:ParB family chromosome partitioning protein
MASKSRLGKGLGALFPALPDEGEIDGVDTMSGASRDGTVKSDNNRKAQKGISTHHSFSAGATSATGDHVSRETQSSGASRVSRETKRRSAAKRMSIPTLDVLAHPSDVFFGADSGISSRQTPSKVTGTGNEHNGESGITAVSRDTKDSVVKSVDTTKSSSLAADADREHIESDNRSSRDKRQSSLGTEADRGLNSGEKETSLEPVAGGYLAELKLEQIIPNSQQPRTIFDEDELKELAASIREVGVLQPIVVRKCPDGQASFTSSSSSPTVDHNDQYELIMGERRWRASQLSGLSTIPAIVKTTMDNEMLRDALLENLHRVALNPLEEAAAYQQMIEEFGLTQAQLSTSVSKSRPQIANMLRLLNLPASVQKKVAAGVLSAGHARALLGLDNESDMEKLANRVIAEGLSVRSTEEIVSLKTLQGKNNQHKKIARANPWSQSPIMKSLENRFETSVSIKGSKKHGRIEIVFSSEEDMERIVKMLIPDSGDARSEWV